MIYFVQLSAFINYRLIDYNTYSNSSKNLTQWFLFPNVYFNNKIKLQMKNNESKNVEPSDKTVPVGENQKGASKTTNKSKGFLNDQETTKILQQVERLIGNNQNLQAINLLRALKDNIQGVKNQNLIIITLLNLGILYYQVGFLEEAEEEFTGVINKLKEASQKCFSQKNKEIMRIKYQSLIGKLQLQICILHSEMGKHDLALEHAKNSSKANYNIIYDVLSKLHGNLNKLLQSKNHPKKEDFIQFQEGKTIINKIAILNHLLSGTKDLKLAFLQKERSNLLEQNAQATRKYGLISPKINMDLLYMPNDKSDHLWIYKNKILEEIQMVPYQLQYFTDSNQEITESDVIQKITFLAISLYCYSTETRFIQKQKNCDSNDVLDSQHWLSRSLEIAYSFLPPQAPILNQILTVHDRFHGLDKQTIPQDEQVSGFFKVLKPLSKPKSTYNSKTPGCSPIMIRIQADKADLQADSSSKTNRQFPMYKNVIELDQSDRIIDPAPNGKNNRIRGFSHGHKRIQTAEIHTERTNNISRATIDSPLSINGNIRSNYVSKKFSRSKDDRLKINFSDLHGKALISQDLLNRPHSLQKTEEREDNFRSTTQRRKKSLPFRKVNEGKRPRTLSNIMKFGGLSLKGQKVEDMIDADIFQKIQHETKMLQSARIGGNIYINNNINLYISKNADISPFGKTYVRGQILQDKANRAQKQKELSRRQIFLNKRRANNFMGQTIQQ